MSRVEEARTAWETAVRARTAQEQRLAALAAEADQARAALEDTLARINAEAAAINAELGALQGNEQRALVTYRSAVDGSGRPAKQAAE